MKWPELQQKAFREVDRWWKRAKRRTDAPNDSGLARIATRFVTRKRIDDIWRDDPDAVRQFAEEHGSEDVLLHPRSELFYEEIGEAIRDQVHGEMLARYRDLNEGQDSPSLQKPSKSMSSTSEVKKPPWWQFWRRNE